MIFLKGQPFPPETYSRWNGNSKHRTRDCDGCGSYFEQAGEERCYWGVAWKRLFPMEKPKKCEYAGKEGPREKKRRESEESKKKWDDRLEKLRQSEEQSKNPIIYEWFYTINSDGD